MEENNIMVEEMNNTEENYELQELANEQPVETVAEDDRGAALIGGIVIGGAAVAGTLGVIKLVKAIKNGIDKKKRDKEILAQYYAAQEAASEAEVNPEEEFMNPPEEDSEEETTE